MKAIWIPMAHPSAAKPASGTRINWRLFSTTGKLGALAVAKELALWSENVIYIYCSFFLGFKSLAFQIGIKLMFCIYMQHNGWWSNCFVELCMWMGHPLWNRLRKIRKPINYVIAVRHGLGWFLLWIAHIWVSIYWQTALRSGSCFGQTWRITKTELRLTI